jgi:hypothetical protein
MNLTSANESSYGFVIEYKKRTGALKLLVYRSVTRIFQNTREISLICTEPVHNYSKSFTTIISIQMVCVLLFAL